MSSTTRRSLFRPCIDLHDGQVKQIVGGTLSDRNPATLKTNFVARWVHVRATDDLVSQVCICAPLAHSQSPGDFARLYKEKGLEGGHLIKLGAGNDEAARQALEAWPGSYTVTQLSFYSDHSLELAHLVYW